MERMDAQVRDAVQNLEGNTAFRIYREWLVRCLQSEHDAYPGIVGDQLLHQSQGRAQVLRELTGKTEPKA